MLTHICSNVNLDLIQSAKNSIFVEEFRSTLNEPTGDFFYDEWTIKPEYKNSPWKELLDTLPFPKGEARIIQLKPGTCYTSHSDIDDRYHLNISGTNSYLIDLDTQDMHKLETDGNWYEMDAGKLHTAVNFGREVRNQLVVRKLLNRTKNKSVKVEIKTTTDNADLARYEFDNQISPVLNLLNKKCALDNFKHNSYSVSFDLDEGYIDTIKSVSNNLFKVIL